MDILNLAVSLFFTASITGLLHIAAKAGERSGGMSGVTSTALALLFVMLFVGAVGWVFQATLPMFASAPTSLGVTAVLSVAVIAVTHVALRRRSAPRAE